MYKAITVLLGLACVSACPVQAGQQPCPKEQSEVIRCLSLSEQVKIQRCLVLALAMRAENMGSSMQAGKKFIDEACADLLNQYYDTAQTEIEKTRLIAAQLKAAKDTGLNNPDSDIAQELKNNSQ